jgi:ketosteroid isomerase-like protein
VSCVDDGRDAARRSAVPAAAILQVAISELWRGTDVNPGTSTGKSSELEASRALEGRFLTPSDRPIRDPRTSLGFTIDLLEDEREAPHRAIIRVHQEGGGIMATREEVDALNARLSAAARSGDLKTIVETYDEEAIFLLADAPAFRGKQGITDVFTEFLSNGPVPMTFTSGDLFESGDLVVDVGSYMIGDGGGAAGRYVVVYRRQADGTLALLVDAPERPATPSDS